MQSRISIILLCARVNAILQLFLHCLFIQQSFYQQNLLNLLWSSDYYTTSFPCPHVIYNPVGEAYHDKCTSMYNTKSEP